MLKERKEIYGRIYLIINTVNQKKYIGQTIRSFKDRYSGGLYKGASNPHFKNAIKKYGEENFRIIEDYHFAYSKEELDYY